MTRWCKKKGMAGFFAGGLFVAVFSFPLGAEDFSAVDLTLRWGAVAGAKGYAVEVKKKNADEASPGTLHRTKETTITVSLEPGSYKLRLSALNKFGRPSVWTPYRDVKITGESKTQSVERLDEKEPPGILERALQYDNLIPTLPAFRNESYGSAAVYGAGFAGLLGGAYSEKMKGDKQALDPMNDPVFLGLTFHQSPIYALFYLRQRRMENRGVYDEHQTNQAAALGLAFGLYLFHIYDPDPLGASESAQGAYGELQWMLAPALDHRGGVDGLQASLGVRF